MVKALRWFGRGRVLCEAEGVGLTAAVGHLLPGERALVEVGADGMLRNARVVEVLTSSPERVLPRCSQASICPGCSMQHVSVAERARYAQTLCSEVLERFGGVAWSPDAVRVVMGEEGGHRARTRLRVRRARGAAAGAGESAGEFSAGDFEVGMAQWPDSSLPFASLDVCVANAPLLREAAAAIRAAAATIIAGGDAELSVELELSSDAAADSGDAGAGADVLWVIASPPELADEFCRVLRDGLRVPPGMRVEVGHEDRAWTHANPSMQARLYGEALSLVDVAGKRVFDLTCGDGGFTLALARAGARVWASDRHWEAVQRCASNVAKAPELAGAIEVRGGDALAVLRGASRRGERVDIVVINPMREPVGEAVMQAVDGSEARAVLYLAPAPKAGAKDLGHLVARGWVLSSCLAVDLHPWTGQPMMVFCALRDALK